MGFTRFENSYLRTPEFIEFISTSAFPTYWILYSSIVRPSEMSKDPAYGGHFIYREYFTRGKLVARYSQKNLAKYRGFKSTSQSSISRHTDELEQKGLLKKIYVDTVKGKSCYYQLGVWQGEWGVDRGPNKYIETIWLDTIFSAYAKVAEEKREGERDNASIPDLMRMMELFAPNSSEWLWARDRIDKIRNSKVL